MISEKMKPFMANNSAIRAMFEEGNRLAKLYGAEKRMSMTSALEIRMCRSRR